MLNPLETRRYTELCDRMRSFFRDRSQQRETDQYLVGKFVRLPSNTKYAGVVLKVLSHGLIIKTKNDYEVYIPFGSEIIVIEGDRK
jgi:hypothetical protein